MRIGKKELEILKVLYDNEQKVKKSKEKYYSQRVFGLRPRKIIEKITKIEYPEEEKDYGITQGKKWRRIMIYASSPNKETLEKVMQKDPMTKMFEEIVDKKDKWHKETIALYRAIGNLHTKGLIWRKKGLIIYGLTEIGRRVISHRYLKNPKV